MSSIADLVLFGANPNYGGIGPNTCPPLHLATLMVFYAEKIRSRRNSLKPMRMFNTLANHAEVDVDCQDRNGSTALHLLCAMGQKCPPGLISVLAKRSKNPNIKDCHGRTPLHLICQTHNEVGLAELLQLDHIKDQNESGLPEQSNSEDINPFLEDRNGMVPFEYLVRLNDNSQQRYVLDQTDPWFEPKRTQLSILLELNDSIRPITVDTDQLAPPNENARMEFIFHMVKYLALTAQLHRHIVQ